VEGAPEGEEALNARNGRRERPQDKQKEQRHVRRREMKAGRETGAWRSIPPQRRTRR
jgi:hypothetical protein